MARIKRIKGRTFELSNPLPDLSHHTFGRFTRRFRGYVLDRLFPGVWYAFVEVPQGTFAPLYRATRLTELRAIIREAERRDDVVVEAMV